MYFSYCTLLFVAILCLATLFIWKATSLKYTTNHFAARTKVARSASPLSNWGSIINPGSEIQCTIDSIRSGKVTELSESKHLVLPKGQAWPDATNNILFVREYYSPLYEYVLERCRPVTLEEDKTSQRRIITGQPGIGKSVFGYIYPSFIPLLVTTYY